MRLTEPAGSMTIGSTWPPDDCAKLEPAVGLNLGFPPSHYKCLQSLSLADALRDVHAKSVRLWLNL